VWGRPFAGKAAKGGLVCLFALKATACRLDHVRSGDGGCGLTASPPYPPSRAG